MNNIDLSEFILDLWVFKLPYNDNIFVKPQKCSTNTEKYDEYGNHFCLVFKYPNEVFKLEYDHNDCLTNGWYHYSSKDKMKEDIIIMINEGSEELKRFYNDNPDFFI